MKGRAVCTAGAPRSKWSARKPEVLWMKRKCYTEAGTALTKMQTEIVLVLGYDHFTCRGNMTHSPGLMGALVSNNPPSVYPQSTTALSLYALFQWKKIRNIWKFLPHPGQGTQLWAAALSQKGQKLVNAIPWDVWKAPRNRCQMEEVFLKTKCMHA